LSLRAVAHCATASSQELGDLILRLVMIGFGNVGQEFAKMLLSKRDWLLKKKGLDVEVLAIATKTRGSLLTKKSLNLERVLDHLKENGSLVGFGPENTDLSPLQIIDKCDADALVELSTLDIETGEPAITHIRTALELGMDVITANKGPVAFAYDQLRDTARIHGVHFRFEGTVMDGTPIFNLVDRTLPGCEVIGLSGILNSTTNFVLDMMLHGSSMEEAVKEAQTRGIAEADPSLDLEGWDAAAKITALANVLMEANTTPKTVRRQGVTDVSSSDLRRAASEGKKLKLVASASRTGEEIELEVKKRLVGPDDIFYSVDGTSSALTIRTDLMGDLTVFESGPGVTQTAYAVFSDLLLLVESIRNGTL